MSECGDSDESKESREREGEELKSILLIVS